MAATGSAARWFLACWVSVVYLTGWLLPDYLHVVVGHGADLIIARGGGQIVAGHLSSGYTAVPVRRSLAFAAAIATHYLLHMLVLVRPPRRWGLGYFAVQTVVLGAVAIADVDVGLAIALTLPLCVEAPLLLSGRRAVLGSVACCVAGLAASVAWHGPTGFVWTTTDYVSLTLFVFGGTLMYVRQRAAHTEQVKLNGELAMAAARIEELTREAERQRMARELHDSLSQGLVGLTMQLQAAISHLERSDIERALGILTGAVHRAHATLGRTRAAIRDLRTASPGLDGVLAVEVARFRAISEVPCALRLDSCADRVRAEHVPLVAHIVGEALTNVARHAEACQVEVTVTRTGPDIVILVTDDGVGFDVSAASGYGLVGMRERSRQAACGLDVTSVVGKGTSVRLGVPASDAAVVAG